MTDTILSIWNRLEQVPQRSLADLFAEDEGRVDRLSQRIEASLGDLGELGILFDWSKTHLDDDLLSEFEALAEATGIRLPGWRSSLPPVIDEILTTDPIRTSP